MRLQAEHNSSQNALFELNSHRDVQEASRQQEAEQAAADLEEAHKKLRQVLALFATMQPGLH